LNLIQPQRKRRVRTTQSAHGLRTYPNLIRGLEVVRLNQVWVADITYVHLPQDFVYFAAPLDAYLRRCIGWQLALRLDSQLALDTLNMALVQRHKSRDTSCGLLIGGSLHFLFEWFAPSFIIGNLAQRFAFLLAFPDGLSRVAERKDREDRDVLGNAQQGVDLRQAVVANPV